MKKMGNSRKQEVVSDLQMELPFEGLPPRQEPNEKGRKHAEKRPPRAM